MATPLKPWERSSNGYRPPAPPGVSGGGGGAGDKKNGDGTGSPKRPAIPPRPAPSSMKHSLILDSFDFDVSMFHDPVHLTLSDVQ